MINNKQMLLAHLPHGVMIPVAPPRDSGEDACLPDFLGTGMIPSVLAARFGASNSGRSCDCTACESLEGLSY